MQPKGRWLGKPAGRYFVGEFGADYYIHVYAVAPKGGGCVKFGQALNVKSRFSSIQTGSPVKLELLGSVYVPWNVEAEVHGYLKDHRSHGEWFYPTVLVMQVADLIAAGKTKDLLIEIGMFQNVPGADVERLNFEQRMASGSRSLPPS